MTLRTTVMLLLVWGLASVVTGNDAERRLTKKLRDSYYTNVRPVLHHKDTVDVTLDMAINMIIDLDERNQLLKSNIWLRMHWTDTHLTWNSSDYDGIENIRLPVTEIWRPDITLYNDVSETLPPIHLYMATIVHDGRVSWYAPAVILSSCPLDVTYFPWDKQVCSMTWGSWSFDGTKVNLFNKSSKWDMTSFIENGEWELEDTPLIRHVEYFQCCVEPYPTLEFQMIIRRKSLYYVANLMLPCAFSTLCALLVFWLPPESGEKVALSVTILLTVTVFLLMVAEAMPAQSLVIPIISWYFLGIIAILSLSTVMTVIILNFHHRGDLREEVPEWMKVLVLRYLAYLVGMTKIVEMNRVRNKIAMQELTKASEIKPTDSSECNLSRRRSAWAPSKGGDMDHDSISISPLSLEGSLIPAITTGRSRVVPLPNLNHINSNGGTQTREVRPDLTCPSSVSENFVTDEKSPFLTYIGDCVDTCINHLQVIFSRLELFRFRVGETRKTERLISEWMLVGEVLDRFFMIFFMIITIVLHAVILLAHP